MGEIIGIVVFVIDAICIFTIIHIMDLIGYTWQAWQTIGIFAAMTVVCVVNFVYGLASKSKIID